jgi:hypothetical protein
LTWDFLQRYDDSWIWRRADRHQVIESARNFAALDECIEDAARHGYIRNGGSARRNGSQPGTAARERRGSNNRA